MFAYFMWVFPFSLNIMRQSIAIAIVCWGYRYIKRHQFFRYLITILVAFGFHTTAILGICLYIINFLVVDTTPIVRVISLTIVISGVKGVQQSYVSRNMLFKRFFYATLGGTIFSALLGIAMAYAGFGVWAIVAQQLSNTAIDTLILWITVKWRPKLMFSWERLKGLLGFGWKLLCSALLETVYNNLRNLMIGKIYSSSDLAYYNQGEKFPKLIVANINTSIDSVLLPVMSKEQDDKEKIKSMTRQSIMASCYIMAPLMIGLACCANNVVIIVLTEKWLSCVFFLRIFCITYMFHPIHTAKPLPKHSVKKYLRRVKRAGKIMLGKQ